MLDSSYLWYDLKSCFIVCARAGWFTLPIQLVTLALVLGSMVRTRAQPKSGWMTSPLAISPKCAVMMLTLGCPILLLLGWTEHPSQILYPVPRSPNLTCLPRLHCCDYCAQVTEIGSPSAQRVFTSAAWSFWVWTLDRKHQDQFSRRGRNVHLVFLPQNAHCKRKSGTWVPFARVFPSSILTMPAQNLFVFDVFSGKGSVSKAFGWDLS